MNTGDVITRVRRTFGDEAAVQVTDADVMRWINDGQIAIVMANDQALQTTAFVNLVAGQSQYTLPADLLALRSLRYKMTDMLSFKHLRYKSMQEFDEVLDGWDGTAYSADAPVYFTMYEGFAILFPTPNASVTSGLKVLYNKRPVDVDDALDALALPLLYHNTILNYCMWQASLLDEDHEVAVMYQSNFSSGLDELQGNETKDPVAVYPTITVLPEDM